MAAPNPADVAQGLVDAVANVVSSTATGSKKLRRQTYLGLKINTPGFYVAERVLPRHGTMGRSGVDGTATFMCRLYAAPHSNDRAGADLLDSYLCPDGPSSVAAAIEADLKLGGRCNQLIVRGVEGYAIYEHGTDVYLGALYRVEVW